MFIRIAMFCITGMLAAVVAPVVADEVRPTLEFPEQGVDDPLTYQGYTTRFYRDFHKNTLQIYIKQDVGRVVNIWGNAANESLGFTARDENNTPAYLTWAMETAGLYSDGERYFTTYELQSKSSTLKLGHFLLGSMRQERDFQYFKTHLDEFPVQYYAEESFEEFVNFVEALPADLQQRHLPLLHTKSIADLRARLRPQLNVSREATKTMVSLTQSTLNDEGHLALAFLLDKETHDVTVEAGHVVIHHRKNQPILLQVRIGTNARPLTPLSRENIFNDDLRKWMLDLELQINSDRLRAEDEMSQLRLRRLQRQMSAMELLCSKEKLMAGLPNYGTYFGRDMMMSVLMLEPVLSPTMLEHVIASVLRRLNTNGEVSHEEGLGNQAIRENVWKYREAIELYRKQKVASDGNAAHTMARAEDILKNIYVATENYHMVDDDFQISLLVQRYLSSPDIPTERRRKFFQSSPDNKNSDTYLSLLLQNMDFVCRATDSYANHPVPQNLIGFHKLHDDRWHAGSWRDSRVGYANGRYAMDINAIWVPLALESLRQIVNALKDQQILGDAGTALAGEQTSVLARWLNDKAMREKAVSTWRDAGRHFEIRMSSNEANAALTSAVSRFPENEQDYWRQQVDKRADSQGDIVFTAIALDEYGKTIPVMHTDPATWLFLEDITGAILDNRLDVDIALQQLKPFSDPYPVGLFLAGVGPVVANDAYASQKIWDDFREDIYHSPLVIWGREVNLLLLGLLKEIDAAHDEDGALRSPQLARLVNEMQDLLLKSHQAVQASGLSHNELWRYRIENGQLLPARYATTTDIQLWNLTDIAVQYFLDKMK